MKTFYCSLCNSERQGNVDTTQKIICGKCIQYLHNNSWSINSYNSPERFKKLHRKLIEKGLKEKADIVNKWLEDTDGKTQKSKRGSDRKTISRMARLTSV